MADYLTRQKNDQQPRSFLTRNSDDGKPSIRDRKAKQAPDPEQEPSSGFVGVDMPPAAPQPWSAPQQQPTMVSNQGGGMQVPAFSDEPTQMTDLSQYLGTPIAQLPAFKQAVEARQKLIALNAMPTYTDSHGRTRDGMQDQDGRLRSGLKGLVAGLASMGPVHNEQELFAGISRGIGAGVGGVITPEWNEWAERSRERQRLQQELKTAEEGIKFQSSMMSADVTRQARVEAGQRSEKSLNDRIARHTVQNLKDEQSGVLGPIMKRGYYYEGDNPDEDAKLAAAKVVLPDFDNTRKPIVDNGVRKAWDVESRAYRQSEGTEVDPDDVPMSFMVDGQKVTASTRQFVGYAGAKERQQSQQTFQAGENEKTRQLKYEQIKVGVAQFRAKSRSDYAAKILAIRKAAEAGDLSPAEAKELSDLLAGNNGDFADSP